jgi:hypothetical protein
MKVKVKIHAVLLMTIPEDNLKDHVLKAQTDREPFGDALAAWLRERGTLTKLKYDIDAT